jgi:hypothetical protein
VRQKTRHTYAILTEARSAISTCISVSLRCTAISVSARLCRSALSSCCAALSSATFAVEPNTDSVSMAGGRSGSRAKTSGDAADTDLFCALTSRRLRSEISASMGATTARSKSACCCAAYCCASRSTASVVFRRRSLRFLIAVLRASSSSRDVWSRNDAFMANHCCFCVSWCTVMSSASFSASSARRSYDIALRHVRGEWRAESKWGEMMHDAMGCVRA